MTSTLNAPPAARLQLSLPCNLEKVRSLSRIILEFLEVEGVMEADRKACELALVEACNNAVLYAPGEARHLPIEVEVSCHGTWIELRVQDHTSGFEWPEHIDLPSAESESGRGLFIIQSMMDEVQYDPLQNRLLMQKRISPPSRATAPAMSATSVGEVDRRQTENEQVIREMSEELSSCYESLSAIFRCGAELGKTNNLEKFSRRLCQDLAGIIGADWFAFRIAVEDESRLIVFTASDDCLELQTVALPKNNLTSSVEARAALSQEDAWFGQEHPLDAEDPLHEFQAGSTGLVRPCFFAGSLIGTLTVGKRGANPDFTTAQTNIVHTFADFLVIQIINARLREEHVGNRLISHELEIAKSIQRALLPKTLPQLPGFSLAGYCESARQVGGDFYDALRVNDDCTLLTIADVMGKGIPAAMFAAILRTLLRASPEMAFQPAALLSRVNRLLFDDLSDVEMFITAALVFVDVKNRRLIAASAGHCPLFLTGKNQRTPKLISPDGLPLGIMREAVFSDHAEPLPPRSRLLLYTDGLTDTQNCDGDFFGEKRLIEWVQSNHDSTQSAEQLKANLAVRVKKFQAHTSLYDDQTFLILTEN